TFWRPVSLVGFRVFPFFPSLNADRDLKKADSAAEPEDASAQQAQDESSKSKKTTRKPATRKTTATQKAKRG
ncbi:hypothetical protein, partial [Pseudomonas aeruginosa]|uniref:hypothetical protein n=1 Tax=Pseudomonas aeruginosa TaxID=287 RepID=UPI0031B6990C